MRSKPPTAVIPEIAFVTDMRGECKAGVTPHTVWYPTSPDKPNVVNIVVNAWFGDKTPKPSIDPIPDKKKNNWLLIT